MGGHRSKWGKPNAYKFIIGHFMIFVNRLDFLLLIFIGFF